MDHMGFCTIPRGQRLSKVCNSLEFSLCSKFKTFKFSGPDAIEPFLTVDPLELYKTKVNTIPTIITTTTIVSECNFCLPKTFQNRFLFSWSQEYSSYIRDNLADPSTINYLDGNFNLSLPFRDIDQTACQKVGLFENSPFEQPFLIRIEHYMFLITGNATTLGWAERILPWRWSN